MELDDDPVMEELQVLKHVHVLLEEEHRRMMDRPHSLVELASLTVTLRTHRIRLQEFSARLQAGRRGAVRSRIR